MCEHVCLLKQSVFTFASYWCHSVIGYCWVKGWLCVEVWMCAFVCVFEGIKAHHLFLSCWAAAGWTPSQACPFPWALIPAEWDREEELCSLLTQPSSISNFHHAFTLTVKCVSRDWNLITIMSVKRNQLKHTTWVISHNQLFYANVGMTNWDFVFKLLKI